MVTEEPEFDVQSRLDAIKAKVRDEMAADSGKPKASDADAPAADAAASEKKESAFLAFLRGVGAWIVNASKKTWEWLRERGVVIGAFFARTFGSKGEESPAVAESAASDAQTASSDAQSETPDKAAKSFGGVLAAAAKHKKAIILGAAGAIVLIVGISLLANFKVVTVAQGIETTLGVSEGRTVIIANAETAAQNDLIVAVLPGSQNSDEETLLIGSVFSLNGETYAVYDGEVIWQVPLSDLRGKVMFASATEAP